MVAARLPLLGATMELPSCPCSGDACIACAGGNYQPILLHYLFLKHRLPATHARLMQLSFTTHPLSRRCRHRRYKRPDKSLPLVLSQGLLPLVKALSTLR